ncbi:hypothetical protein N5M43_003750 [Klebsiella pneumoniae]
MTTDITELAQREKFEAWWEREYKHLESSKYTDAVPHIQYGFWTAYQAGGAELVEALEKAQQHIARKEQILLNQDESLSILRGELEKARAQSSKWLEAYHKAVSIGARYEERLAELEEAEQKLCAANVTLDARAELAERRLAEMESRTVKLTDINEYLAEVHDKTLNRAFRLLAEGVRAGDVAAMRAAGIKMEVE